MTNTILIGLAVVVLFMYLMRRRSRLSASDDE
jgi:hypothetical protein